MSLFSKSQRDFVEAVAELTFANPFQERRVELERKALGKDFDESTPPHWSWTLHDEADRPNVIKLTERVFRFAEQTRQKLAEGSSASDVELELFDDLAHYVIYYSAIACQAEANTSVDAIGEAWEAFNKSFEYWMNVEGKVMPSYENKAHVFAYLCQVRRAFSNIYLCVIGRSRPIAKMRARIWQSVFTHDMRRYRRTLFNRLRDVSTLVTGPSGTGKELVARAVGLSQYRPFDPKSKTFVDADQESFHAINLSALSPTLIESELFGHAKGSFTGATSRRSGYLEAAGRYGCVFLDEIGELDAAIQVKLLRVLQSRQFQRVGENKTRDFYGKIVSATNRNLHSEIAEGRFREDFFYRICSDVIETPSLVEQLRDQEDEFEFLVGFLSGRIAPDEQTELGRDVMRWAREHLPVDYSWPGNTRELEQCVRNIMIHNNYIPPTCRGDVNDVGDLTAESALAKRIREVNITADELVSRYCQIAYQKTNSYEKAAELLKLDRRTVRSKIVSLRTVD